MVSVARTFRNSAIPDGPGRRTRATLRYAACRHEMEAREGIQGCVPPLRSDSASDSFAANTSLPLDGDLACRAASMRWAPALAARPPPPPWPRVLFGKEQAGALTGRCRE